MSIKIADFGNNFNEKLVELVRKHKILYDNTTEGYSNIQSQDEIWRKIATDLNEEVASCKLRWKNIRSCYTRYLRQISSKNCKIKRTYYLARQLGFLFPFCKPNARHSADHPTYYLSDENSFLHYDDPDLGPSKSEPNDDGEDEVVPTKMESSVGIDEESSEKQFDEDEGNTSNKRPIWDTNSEFECFKRSKVVGENSDEAEMNFFKSLLPDIRKMDGRQKNQLKISILKAVDGILYKDSS